MEGFGLGAESNIDLAATVEFLISTPRRLHRVPNQGSSRVLVKLEFQDQFWPIGPAGDEIDDLANQLIIDQSIRQRLSTTK